jgi:hypothetical protein
MTFSESLAWLGVLKKLAACSSRGYTLESRPLHDKGEAGFNGGLF